jgi:hypothetical protein
MVRSICGTYQNQKRKGLIMKNENEKTPDLPFDESVDRTLGGPPFEVEKTTGLTFEEYDGRYPEIWHEFVKLAFGLIRKGRDHYGARCLVEVIRYHRDLECSDRDFKINNNFISDYARKFAAKFPAYKTFFKFRKRKSERGPHA